MRAITGAGERSEGLEVSGEEAGETLVAERARLAGPGSGSARPDRASPGVTEVGRGQTRAQTGKLMDHGGGVLEHVDVAPVYLGRYWGTKAGVSDLQHNDAAMADLVKNGGMTGLWKEYGAGKGTTQPSMQLPNVTASRMTQERVEALVKQQVEAGKFDTSDPQRVFTLVLPPGCELQADGGASSRNGLGGYHGSVNVGGKEVYYAAIAYSERTAAGMNGIDFTGNPQDNLSIVESHEITEAVTDPNVEVAMREGDLGKLGWYDDVTRWQTPGSGEVNVGKGEIGDIPVLNAELAGDVSLRSVWGRSDGFAFQKEWSNRDHTSELAPS